jgi:hypothetical protein
MSAVQMGIMEDGGAMQLETEAGRGRNVSNRYRVRRIGLGSLSKFGCVLGGLVSLLPSLIVGWAGTLLVGGLRRLLESWQGAGIHVLGQEIRIDFVSLLGLEPLLRTVQEIDSLSWAIVLLFAILTSLLGGLVFLVMGNLLGWVYNFIATVSGGLEVELREVSKRQRRAMPPRAKR